MCMYMIAIAGRTAAARPNRLNLFEETHGHRCPNLKNLSGGLNLSRGLNIVGST